MIDVVFVCASGGVVCARVRRGSIHVLPDGLRQSERETYTPRRFALVDWRLRVRDCNCNC